MNKAKNKAPPIIGTPEGDEELTNKQIKMLMQSIIEIVLLIVPDIPERAKLIEVIERIKTTE